MWSDLAETCTTSIFETFHVQDTVSLLCRWSYFSRGWFWGSCYRAKGLLPEAHRSQYVDNSFWDNKEFHCRVDQQIDRRQSSNLSPWSGVPSNFYELEVGGLACGSAGRVGFDWRTLELARLWWGVVKGASVPDLPGQQTLHFGKGSCLQVLAMSGPLVPLQGETLVLTVTWGQHFLLSSGFSCMTCFFVQLSLKNNPAFSYK